jgi:hypothetical protein
MMLRKCNPLHAAREERKNRELKSAEQRTNSAEQRMNSRRTGKKLAAEAIRRGLQPEVASSPSAERATPNRTPPADLAKYMAK